MITNISNATFYQILASTGFIPINDCSYEAKGKNYSLKKLFTIDIDRGHLLCRPAPPKNLMTMRGNLELIVCPIEIKWGSMVETHSIPSLTFQKEAYGIDRRRIC